MTKKEEGSRALPRGIGVVQIDDEVLVRRMWRRLALEGGLRPTWAWEAYDGKDVDAPVVAIRRFVTEGRAVILIQDYMLDRGTGDVFWQAMWAKLTDAERASVVVAMAYTATPNADSILSAAFRASPGFVGKIVVPPKPCTADQFFGLLPP